MPLNTEDELHRPNDRRRSNDAATTERAVRRLFLDDARAIHRYAARRVGPDVADDVVSETFRRALESYDSFDPDRGPARHWLFGIATNVLRGYWRTERRRLAALERLDGSVRPESGDPLPGVAERVDASDDLRQVVRAVANLARDDYELVVLASWEQLSSDDISQIMGIPAGTVRSRLHRIRGQLDRARITPQSSGSRSEDSYT